MTDLATTSPGDNIELVRRWPAWLARLLNRLVHWTDEYCTGGCGYPVTGRYRHILDEYRDTPIVALLCELDGPCEEQVGSNFIDQDGFTYAQIRPHLVELLDNAPADPESVIRLSYAA